MTIRQVRYPIIQAPMAGIAARPELVAAVSNAGGLGSLGAAYMSPAQIEESIGIIRALTERPFNVNLFAVKDFPAEPRDLRSINQLLAPFHEELGIAPLEGLAPPQRFEEQVETVLRLRVPVFSFTFGIPDREVISRFQQQGSTVVGTATTTEEGLLLEEAGVDAVVAQGSEAGAHRGTFAGPFEQAMVSILALVPQLVRAIKLPVIASGAIMDGQGIRAAMQLGAEAVQMGTAFLVCPESGIPSAYRNAILHAKDTDTEITTAFSGRPARGIRNRITLAAKNNRELILPYPWQNQATRPMRNEAARRDNPDFLSLWAGQGASMARVMPASDLVQLLASEAGLDLPQS